MILLYGKLNGRGYSGSILKRFFLKFCGRYPVDLKFNVADGNALWDIIFEPPQTNSCCVYDYEAIHDITKPCKVVLEDLYPSNTHTTNTEGKSNDSYHFSPTSYDDKTIPEGINFIPIPQPLDNPRNHCYINSTLQVIYRILFHFNDNFNINNNREGCLVKCLVDDMYTNSNCSLSNFKKRLAKYDTFFNGYHQQDALECLTSLMDIIHIGTRENLLGDNSSTGFQDDQFVYSLTKRLFLFNFKHSMKCLRCRLITSFYSESKTHFLYPRPNCSIKDILDSGMNSTQTKWCSCCDLDTDHDVHTKIEHPPEILVLIINRVSDSGIGDKNRDRLFVNDKLVITNFHFNLLGTIHHHGRTIQSGHYTSNIFYIQDQIVVLRICLTLV